MSFWNQIRTAMKMASIAPVVALPVEPANDVTVSSMPAVLRTVSRMRYTDLQRKPCVRGGRRHEGEVMVGHHADVYPRNAIRLYGWETNARTPHTYDRHFAIGDVAAYGGGNITDTGKIVSIGEKTVKIKDGSQVRALDIVSFSAWNRDFDAVTVAVRNARVLEGC